VRVLVEHGHPYAQRAYGAGRHDDRGDVAGVPGFVIEAKNHGRFDLSGWMREAEVEAANVGPGTLPVVVVKRRLRAPADAYAIMRLADWATITRLET
ncbi:MAG: hypothetical protein ACP5PW_09340, partial [Candidatus Dormibacteria bacterium]